MVKAILINRTDNVATVMSEILKSQVITIIGGAEIKTITAKETIPYGHKIALTHINNGDKIIKYGNVIGYAKTNIKCGEWAHTHNIKEAYIPQGKQRLSKLIHYLLSEFYY